ncbi:MAG: peptidylprolyl isomerase [Microscillaceae bacterium]|nr:peptidylprolyl isomerase [Microscillaceae bacterium]
MQVKLVLFLGFILLTNALRAQVDSTVDRILVRLEQQIILQSDLENLFRGLVQEGRIQPEDDSPEIRCELLEFLVTNTLMLAVADRDSVKVAPEAVEYEIDRRIDLQTEGWTDQDFKRAFGKTRDDLKKEMYPVMEEQLLVQKMENQLIGSIQVTPQEVKDHFKNNPNSEMPEIEAEVEVGQIVILPSRSSVLKYRYGAEPSASQAADFLDSLRHEIQAGNIPFEEAAREFSDHLYTADHGGYILSPSGGGQKVFVSELDSYIYFVADTMQIGTISKPMPYRGDQGEEGSRIIYLKSKSPLHQATFEQDFDKLKIIALQAKREQFIKNWFKKNIASFALEMDETYKDCIFFKAK